MLTCSPRRLPSFTSAAREYSIFSPSTVDVFADGNRILTGRFQNGTENSHSRGEIKHKKQTKRSVLTLSVRATRPARPPAGRNGPAPYRRRRAVPCRPRRRAADRADLSSSPL